MQGITAQPTGNILGKHEVKHEGNDVNQGKFWYKKWLKLTLKEIKNRNPQFNILSNLWKEKDIKES